MKKYSFLIICTLLTGLLFTTCEPWIVPEAVFVNFNANGGQGDMKAQRFEDGEKQNLELNSFTRKYYNFAGWNTRADGKGLTYRNGQIVSLSKSCILYAQWERITYSLTFNANGGKGKMDPQTFEEGVSQAIAANTFTRDGYNFAGWNTKADGSGTSYTDKQSITLTNGMTLYAQWSGTENGYQWVDLGLPSGLKWATCNVGATSPEGYGDYFAWGETEPKTNYDWSTYKYSNDLGTSLTKYNTSGDYGTVDNKTTLEFTDDAARTNWGGKWRMPTTTEQQELINNCTWTLTTQNGVIGYKVTSKTNGNSIFLPEVGYRDGTVSYVGSYGYYWSSSLLESYPLYAYYLDFSSGVDWGCGTRDTGRTVRAVFSENDTPSTFVTLSFDANGGEGTMPAQTFEAGVSQAITANTFTRSGYTFTGWNTNANGSGTAYTDKQSITLTQDITLYAQWKKDIVNYTITFNANGGTGTMAAQTFEAGVSQAIAANAFTRSSYTFTGWNTKADGSGTSYTDKQSITLSQDITLYAQWEQEQVVSGTENDHDYVDLGLPSGLKWATCNVGATAPEGYGDYFAWGETEPKSNYDWSTYKYCKGSYDTMTKYCTQSSYGTVDNKTTLELSDDAARVNWGGNWRMPTRTEQDELRNNCTWTWSTQNGVRGYKVTSKTNGNSIFLPAAGYRSGTSVSFVGSLGYFWSSSLKESYPNYARYLYFGSDDVDWNNGGRYYGYTVRAVISDDTPQTTIYTLTFNANGGSGTMAAQTFEAGVSQAIAANAFTRSGYTFTGWNTNADGSGTSYTDKQSITISQDITLYAQWKKDIVNYTVTFNANGGTGTMAAQTFEAGVSQALAANKFTRDGYTFAGWNTAADGSGTSYTDGQEITLTQDITLYAQWNHKQVVSGTENGHDYVDLGLSVKWATCNVGATTPDGYGDYFAWGETAPKTNYDWSTYKYCNGSSSTLTKYNTESSRGTVDNKTTLEISDDAARAYWGGSWRMPSEAELDELLNNCIWTWSVHNGVEGYKVTSKTNGNSIFLPEAGEWQGASFHRSRGYYRSSSLLNGNSSGACGLRFGPSFVERFDFYRHYGRTVRAVCP